MRETERGNEKETEQTLLSGSWRDDGFDDSTDCTVFLHYVDCGKNSGNCPRRKLCRTCERNDTADYKAGDCGFPAGWDDWERGIFYCGTQRGQWYMESCPPQWCTISAQVDRAECRFWWCERRNFEGAPGGIPEYRHHCGERSLFWHLWWGDRTGGGVFPEKGDCAELSWTGRGIGYDRSGDSDRNWAG